MNRECDIDPAGSGIVHSGGWRIPYGIAHNGGPRGPPHWVDGTRHRSAAGIIVLHLLRRSSLYHSRNFACC
jgi:hypothetical protein